jgi:hypothetical protein
LNYRNWGMWALAVGAVGCGGVGKTDESVALPGVGISITVPTGGKLDTSGDGPEIRWAGFSFAARIQLNTRLSDSAAQPLKFEPSGTYDGMTQVVVGGKRYVCWVSAKQEADAKRLQNVCDTLAAASPKAPPGGSAQTVEYEDKSIASLHCTIKIPKGAKTLAEDEYTATYSLPLPDGMSELNISANVASTPSLDQAKRMSTMMGGTIASAKTLPNGYFEVVNDAQGIIQTVNTFAPKFGAKCSGPPSYLTKLIEMCDSVQCGAAQKASVEKPDAKAGPASKAPPAAKAAGATAPAKAAAPAKPAAPAAPGKKK